MIFLLLACTTPDAPLVQGPDDDTGASSSDCRAAATDAVHSAVVSLPFASPDTGWVAYRVQDDSLTETGRFSLGARAAFGRVAWTPDGAIGAVPLEDGTIGLISALDGAVEVIEPTISGDFYASNLYFSPDGSTLWIVDGNWANNGGGLYKLPIDCETGAPGAATFVRSSKLAAALLLGERTVLVAQEVDDQSGYGAWELDGPEGEVLRGVALFDYADSSISDAVMGPGGHVWVADNSLWSGQDNHVVVLEADLSKRHQVPIVDPVAIVPAPTGSDALVLSAYGADALVLLKESGEVETVQSSPLPWSAAGLIEGPDAGLALVSENEALLLLRVTSTVDELVRIPLSGDQVPGVVGLSP